MSVETVRSYLEGYGLGDKIQEFRKSSATVEEASRAAGVEPARIAKTLAFNVRGEPVVVCIAGDCRVDNRKFREVFGTKAKMLSRDETFSRTGHHVGGVCPFALPENVQVCLDRSLLRFETVFPACGSSNSAIEIAPKQLREICPGAQWIDVGKRIGSQSD